MAKGGESTERTGSKPRLRLAVVIGVAIVVIGGFVAYELWGRGDELTGPAPTVSPAESCGGGAPGAVLALDAKTGSLRWSALVGDADQLLLVDDVVVAAGGGAVRALDTEAGIARWCRDVSVNQDGARGAVLAGGRIVVATQQGVMTFRPGDGKVAWTKSGLWDQLGGAPDLVVLNRRAVPLAAKGPGVKAYLPVDRVVEAFDATTGKSAWTLNEPATRFIQTGATQLMTGPGGVVYVDGKPIDLHGQVVTPPGCPASTPASRLQLTVAPSSGMQHRIKVGVCDAYSGKRIWAKTVPGYEAEMIDQTVVVSDQSNGTGVTLSSGRSKLTGYRAADGSVDWQLDLPQSVGLWPAGSGAFLWTTGRDPLTFVDVATHHVSWSVNPGNPGRSRKYRDSDDVRQVIYDPVTDGIYVLLVAQEPYRD